MMGKQWAMLEEGLRYTYCSVINHVQTLQQLGKDPSLLFLQCYTNKTHTYTHTLFLLPPFLSFSDVWLKAKPMSMYVQGQLGRWPCNLTACNASLSLSLSLSPPLTFLSFSHRFPCSPFSGSRFQLKSLSSWPQVSVFLLFFFKLSFICVKGRSFSVGVHWLLALCGTCPGHVTKGFGHVRTSALAWQQRGESQRKRINNNTHRHTHTERNATRHTAGVQWQFCSCTEYPLHESCTEQQSSVHDKFLKLVCFIWIQHKLYLLECTGHDRWHKHKSKWGCADMYIHSIGCTVVLYLSDHESEKNVFPEDKNSWVIKISCDCAFSFVSS